MLILCHIYFTGFAFLCPNGTLFNQQVFVCDWHYHVDCKNSENYYGKNLEMNMKFDNVIDMMAVVNEMVTFPLKIPSEAATANKFSTNFNQQPVLSTKTPNINQNLPLLTPNVAPTSNQPQNGIFLNINRPNTKLLTKTTTAEGDINLRTTTGIDKTSNFGQSTLTAKPIYISSLGELSTDLGDKFDVTKVRLIQPDESSTGKSNNRNNLSMQSAVLSQPILPNNQNGNQFTVNAVDSGEGDLLNKSIRRKQMKPDSAVNIVNLSESGLLSPSNDSNDGLIVNAVNSGENDLLNQSIQRQRDGTNLPVDSGFGNILGQSIQNKQSNPNENFFTQAISSGMLVAFCYLFMKINCVAKKK